MSELPYTSDYAPVAPVLPVSFVARSTGQASPAQEGLVDTGSDITVVPVTLLDSIGALPGIVRTAVGLWGGRCNVTLYNVDVNIGQHIIRYVDVIGSPEREEIILGRNLINELVLLLDGPNATLELIESR